MTGDNTVIGQIANLATSGGDEETTLRKELNRFINYITVCAISVGLSFFILGFIFGYGILKT